MAKKIKKGSPKWMATFADLSTLLLTFFVLMLSFASIDIEKFRDMLGSIQNAFGVQAKIQGEFQAVETERTAKADSTKKVNEVKVELDQMAEKINETIEATKIGEQTEIKVGSNGVRIRITGNIMFDAGQAYIKYQAYPFLDGIAEAMHQYDYYLLVEGHTDSLAIHTAQFPSNWELSSARASAVVRYMIDKGIPQTRLSGIGHASNFPLASNATPEGREQNRRVEFIFTKTPFRSVFN